PVFSRLSPPPAPPPPSPPLFPYTTLFRSLMDCRALAFSQLPHQPKLFLAYLEKFESVKAFYAHPPTIQAVTQASRKLDYPAERRDRKSTRLNSSHSQISYAVFCSKKKTTNGQPSPTTATRMALPLLATRSSRRSIAAMGGTNAIRRATTPHLLTSAMSLSR